VYISDTCHASYIALMTLSAFCTVRRSTHSVKTVISFTELNDLRCANISLISSTSWSICRKSTWWTACWKTSPYFRSL